VRGMGEIDVHFGEQGALLTYGSYLRLPQLLDAQHLESDPPAHDELLFITIHQVYELWFQQLLHEATAARDVLVGHRADGFETGASAGFETGASAGFEPGASAPSSTPASSTTASSTTASTGGGLWWALHLLGRMHVIERTLVQQVDVLETMTPQDFLEFRQRLAPASGFQSVQFRELEFLSGAKDPSYVDRFRGLTDDERARLARRLDEPSLWDGFLAVLASHDLPHGTDAEVRASVRTAAHDRAAYAEVWQVAEALLQHDELAASWRARHVVMVERMIGSKSGTGGSSGAGYLRTRLDLRYFPLLWEARSEL